MTAVYQISKLAHATMFAPGTAFARWGAKVCAHSKNPMQGPAPLRALGEVSKAVLYRCKDCGDCSLPDIAYLAPNRNAQRTSATARAAARAKAAAR